MPQKFPSFGDDLPVTRQALAFTAEHHEGQRRESHGAPFILHPLEVAHVLCIHGYPDRVVAAGLLHDLLDYRASLLVVEERLGHAPLAREVRFALEALSLLPRAVRARAAAEGAASS